MAHEQGFDDKKIMARQMQITCDDWLRGRSHEKVCHENRDGEHSGTKTKSFSFWVVCVCVRGFLGDPQMTQMDGSSSWTSLEDSDMKGRSRLDARL